MYFLFEIKGSGKILLLVCMNIFIDEDLLIPCSKKRIKYNSSIIDQRYSYLL